MKIYLLTRRIPEEDMRYDENRGMVVVARSSAMARKHARTCSITSGDETADLWLDPKQAKCSEIGFASRRSPGVLLRDFRAG